ncbi:MAG: YihA family ribosome biogenesis GTP-binding protein [Phycisphaerales bacterium]|nr:YihA family ribosome biogenesis GTP-binding protein [Phycisphaerales bacterium]
MRNPSDIIPFPPSTTVDIDYWRSIRFLRGVNALNQLPPDTGREVAFAGRSNAGKSSAINRLTDQRGLARVSKTPGRTQLLNFFVVKPERHLVDLPGYGYARVPDSIRRHWGELLKRYLHERVALQGLVLLMDIRHPLTETDRQLLDSCAARELAVHVLLTKADKLSRGAASAALAQLKRALAATYPGATAQLFSALTGQGINEARTRLHDWLE